MAETQTPSSLNTAVLGASVSAAVVYGCLVRATPCTSRMVFKTTATALLSLFAGLNHGPGLLVAALALGACGDAFLAWPGEEAFLGGLGSFLVSHVCYLLVFSRVGGGTGVIAAEGWRQLVAVVASCSTLAMGVALVPRVGASLRLPIVLYSTAILGMVLGALTMPEQLVVRGAVLFAASDSFLATDEFLLAPTSWHRVWMQYAVWLLYYSGQLLIVTGIVGVA